MEYFKLVAGVLVSPPEIYQDGDTTIFSYRKLIFENEGFRKKEGYYPLTNNKPAYNTHAQRLEVDYLQKSDKIEAVYTVVELSDEEKRSNYVALITEYVHRQYSLDDEMALQRKDRAGRLEPGEFEAYDAYAESCKAEAHIAVYGE